MPSPRPSRRSAYTPSVIHAASVAWAIPHRMAGSGSPSMAVSSVVRSASGRSPGTLSPLAFTCSQNVDDMVPILPPCKAATRPGCRLPYACGVPSLTDLVKAHTDLSDDDVAWLNLLMADWQIIADLSFADLVLWLPDRDAKGYWAGAQMRPTTGPTAY